MDNLTQTRNAMITTSKTLIGLLILTPLLILTAMNILPFIVQFVVSAVASAFLFCFTLWVIFAGLDKRYVKDTTAKRQSFYWAKFNKVVGHK